jgi:hypothetical protein
MSDLGLPSRYNFDHTIEAGKYTVQVSSTEGYGYFENNLNGSGGGLWFEGKELADYDGMSELPRVITIKLREHGFIVGPEFD